MMSRSDRVHLFPKNPPAVAAEVIMSSLATLPAITASYTKDEQVAIFTANGQSLLGILELGEECGI